MLALSHDESGAWQSQFLPQTNAPGDDLAEVRQCARPAGPSMWTHPARKPSHGQNVRSAGPNECLGDLELGIAQFDPPSGLLNLVDDLTASTWAEPALLRDDFVQFGFQVD